jgi:uncharacterized SAM-binding protein YcdF (DUF218 family)
MLTMLLVMLLVAALLYRLRRRTGGHVVMALTVLLFFGVACGPIATLMVYGLQGSYLAQPPVDWASRNVILVLGAGTVQPGDEALQPLFMASGRLLRGAQLYRACKDAGKQCRLLVSGGDSQGHGEAESTVYVRALNQLGVPASDLMSETRSMTTWQNAQFSRPLLVAYAPQHVLLVTSGTHLKRSLLYFGHFGMTPQPVAGDWVATVWTPFPAAWNIAAADIALHEYLGILRYQVYHVMGWNAAKAPSLAI